MIILSNDLIALEAYLKEKEWLMASETVLSAEKPGEGNMNFTLRIQTNLRSFILKQSRGYVEKYPQVAAPESRAMMEAAFYNIIQASEALSAKTPKVIAKDEENNVLMLEDLGEGSDFARLYKQGESIDANSLEEIIDFAATLHNAFEAKNFDNPIRNLEMRKLNHEHMFIYPYLQENGLNLDDILPGLRAVADSYKKDEVLKSKVITMGDLYMADGNSLLHGDYFPGSWLQTNQGIRIIDPEFCFFGLPEFEIGVTIAHLMMADQPYVLIEQAINQYNSKVAIDDDLRAKFTATEILRRILGLAQLPLNINLGKRKALLEFARETLIS